MPALHVVLGTYRRAPARCRPGAARSTHSALWPPPAVALCRAAFAGGRVPFHASERSLVIFSPSWSSLPWFLRRSRTAIGPLGGIGLGRVCAVTSSVCAGPLLLVIVLVSGAETPRSGCALVHGALRAALGMRSPFPRRPPAPRRCIGAEVPARVGARVRRGR